MQLISKIEVLKVRDDFSPPKLTPTNENFQQQGEHFEIDEQNYYLNHEIVYYNSSNEISIISTEKLKSIATDLISHIKSIKPIIPTTQIVEIRDFFIDNQSSGLYSPILNDIDKENGITKLSASQNLNKSPFGLFSTSEFELPYSDEYPKTNWIMPYFESIYKILLNSI